MAKLAVALYENKEMSISCGIYKALGSTIARNGEYHFSLSELNEKTREWTYIATYTDTIFLRLVGDICETLFEYQEVAETIDNEHKSKRNKRPIL